MKIFPGNEKKKKKTKHVFECNNILFLFFYIPRCCIIRAIDTAPFFPNQFYVLTAGIGRVAHAIASIKQQTLKALLLLLLLLFKLINAR